MRERSRAERSKYKTSALEGLRQEDPTANKLMDEEKKEAFLDHMHDKSTTRQSLGFISFMYPAPQQGCHPPSALTSSTPLEDVAMDIHWKPNKSLQKWSPATKASTVS